MRSATSANELLLSNDSQKSESRSNKKERSDGSDNVSSIKSDISRRSSLFRRKKK